MTNPEHTFVEDTNEIASKLLRLGYEIQETYPNSGFFNNFSRVMYNKKYNIAIHLYKKAGRMRTHLLKTQKIPRRKLLNF